MWTASNENAISENECSEQVDGEVNREDLKDVLMSHEQRYELQWR